jgi:glycerol-3-phosphate dehydrogenase
VLQRRFTRGFAYSDCWVDDSRLVILNARDAADRGATIETRTVCVAAERVDGSWLVSLQDVATGRCRTIRAKALVNAAGPWIGEVAGSVIRANVAATVRLVQGSHIVVPRLYRHEACYIFQNTDGRVFFVIPYEWDFTLIGTTDLDFTGDPGGVTASAEEISYLCKSTSAYLRTPVTPEMVVWSYSGVRSLYDDGSPAPQQATRDYVLKLDAAAGGAPLLSVFGGKITTYRRLAEAALAMLGPYLSRVAGQPAGWTGRVCLPGGDFPVDGFDRQLGAAVARYKFVPEPTLRRLLRAYGSRIDQVLRGANCLADLGRQFGAGLTEAELRHLVQSEWARTAADVVWRRSKLGLRLSADQIAAIDDAMHPMVRDVTGVPSP